MYELWIPLPLEIEGAVTRLTEARGQVLRLARALVAIGVDPRKDVPLRFPLVKLVELDLVLLGTLARIRQGHTLHAELAAPLIAISHDKRQRMRDALPP